VNNEGDAADFDTADDVCDTNDSANDGPCTLRAAIQQANATAGADAIVFNLTGDTKIELSSGSPLPAITGDTDIDGDNTAGDGTDIALDGDGVVGIGLHFAAGSSGSSVNRFAVSEMDGDGIGIDGGVNNVSFTHVRSGIRPPTNVSSNTGDGLHAAGPSSNISITGDGTGSCLFSGNAGDGIELINVTGATISGCNIGLDGASPPTNARNDWNNDDDGDGIRVTSSTGVVIGGSISGTTRNIIGRNQNGIRFINSTGAGNVIKGNFIGISTDNNVRRNFQYGVLLENSSNILIGGTGHTLWACDGDCNLISGNGDSAGDFPDPLGGTSDLDDGVHINGGGNNRVQGNFIGTALTGASCQDVDFDSTGNDDNGVEIVNSDGNLIGGTAAGAGNLISCNGSANDFFDGDGVKITRDSDNNLVQGNRIGTDPSGLLGFGNNGDGVDIESNGQVQPDDNNGNVVGGTVPGAGNLIADNDDDGIELNGSMNRAEGNIVGLAVDGTVLGNDQNGIADGGDANVIGGPTSAHRNIISGNQDDGVDLDGDNALVQNNYIGTDPTGTLDRGNEDDGIDNDDDGNRILNNLISGNDSDGVEIDNDADATIIRGNLIGVTAGGNAGLGNSEAGIQAENDCDFIPNVTVGGTNAADRNVISGNWGDGIAIDGGGCALVQGNYIGLGADGSTAIANGGDGIDTDSSSSRVVIGGSTASARNVVSGNTEDGIALEGDDHTVQGNYIGTNAAGNAARPNGDGTANAAGIFIFFGSGNLVGGTNPGEGNLIAFNAASGIALFGGDGNRFLGNRIHSNQFLGIDLDADGGSVPADGPTPNDANDADGGLIPNQLQNFGVINAGQAFAGLIMGTLDTPNVPGVQYRIEVFSNAVCDPSGFGEGEQFHGAATITDGAADPAFAVFTSPAIGVGRFVTVTATNLATGDTSEFSPCVAATANPATITLNYAGTLNTRYTINGVINQTCNATTTCVNLPATAQIQVAGLNGPVRNTIITDGSSVNGQLNLNTATNWSRSTLTPESTSFALTIAGVAQGQGYLNGWRNFLRSTIVRTTLSNQRQNVTISLSGNLTTAGSNVSSNSTFTGTFTGISIP
jgi:hypothetical protein